MLRIKESKCKSRFKKYHSDQEISTTESLRWEIQSKTSSTIQCQSCIFKKLFLLKIQSSNLKTRNLTKSQQEYVPEFHKIVSTKNHPEKKILLFHTCTAFIHLFVIEIEKSSTQET